MYKSFREMYFIQWKKEITNIYCCPELKWTVSGGTQKDVLVITGWAQEPLDEHFTIALGIQHQVP